MECNDQKTVVGLIGPLAPGGSRLGDSQEWCLVLQFAAHRFPGEPVVEEETRLEIPMSMEALEREMDSLDALQIVEVELSDESSPGRVIAARILDKNSKDSELRAIATELDRPIFLDTEDFGRLLYRRDVQYYCGEATWNGELIQLNLEAPDLNDVSECLETARELFKNAATWQQRVNDYAVRELLPVKNDAWLDGEESEVTSSQFVERMTLECIFIEEEGGFSFMHQDGDLFSGHTIEVSGDIQSGPNLADIPG